MGRKANSIRPRVRLVAGFPRDHRGSSEGHDGMVQSHVRIRA